MKKTFTSILAVMVGSVAFAATVELSYVPAGSKTDVWGTKRAETYSVAVKVPGSGLEGKKVTSVTVPVPEGVNMSDCAVFVTKELKGSRGNIQADLTYNFEPSSGNVVVTVPEAYTISGDFYAGYTFKIAKVDEASALPVVVGGTFKEGGFYLTTSRTYTKLLSFDSPGVSLALKVGIEGDFLPSAAVVAELADAYVLPGVASEGKAVVRNVGSEPIKSLSYTYLIDGKKTEGEVSFPEAIPADLLTTAEFSYSIPVIDNLGSYGGTLTLTKVNGVECNVVQANSVHVMQQLPERRVTMEEFTGTWCGWCPRGLVALTLLNETFSDRFIGMSYHSGDIMQTMSSMPVNVSGYPEAALDRAYSCDPYFGSGKNDMDISLNVAARLGLQVAANVEVEAAFNDDLTKIAATGTTFYFKEFAENPYLLSFAVTADGLGAPADTPDSPDWLQNNSYSGDTEYGPQMEEWQNGPSPMATKYDDVVLASAPYKGIADSQPAAVSAGETASGKYEFDCSSFMNPKYGVSLLQDPEKVYVVALLVNKATGVIENAAKVKVTVPPSASVNTLGSEAEVIARDYYDISGRRLNQRPSGGLYIERATYSDGSVRAAKRIR